MQHLSSSCAPPRPWWFLAGALAVVVLGVFLLHVSQAQPARAAQQAAPTPATVASVVPVVTWTYTPAAPHHFVIRRSLDGGTWQDVAVLPGVSGTGLTWQDTTLPATGHALVVHYVVYAVTAGNVWSEASNRAISTVGGAPRRPSPSVTVVRADSAETQAGKHPARLAGDGDPQTMWHTKWSGTPAPLPHWIVLDLGAVLPVDGLAYLPRQDGSPQGRIAQYEVSVSQDNAAWSAPVAVGTWLWYEKPLEQYVRWPAAHARYVRLKSLTEAAGGPWSSAAEVGLYAGTAEPVGVSLGECVGAQTTPQTTVITCTRP